MKQVRLSLKLVTRAVHQRCDGAARDGACVAAPLRLRLGRRHVVVAKRLRESGDREVGARRGSAVRDERDDRVVRVRHCQ